MPSCPTFPTFVDGYMTGTKKPVLRKKHHVKGDKQGFWHKQRNKTLRPTRANQVTCKFKFTIYECLDEDRFFIRGGQGNNCHNGHPKVFSWEIPNTHHSFDQNERKIHHQLSKISAPPSISKKIIRLTRGTSVCDSTIKKIR